MVVEVKMGNRRHLQSICSYSNANLIHLYSSSDANDADWHA